MVIDDDVVRVRSRNFEMETGMPLVNNPEKGMGAVQNVCVVMPSGFFFGFPFFFERAGCQGGSKNYFVRFSRAGGCFTGTNAWSYHKWHWA